MFCQKCGNNCSDDLRFCPNCGSALSLGNAAPQQPQQQPPYQPYQQPYQQPQGYGYPVAQGPKGLAIASLVLGIISFFLFPAITGTLGIVLGGVAKSKGATGSVGSMATGGIVCGIVGVVLWIIMLIAVDSMFSMIGL